MKQQMSEPTGTSQRGQRRWSISIAVQLRYGLVALVGLALLITGGVLIYVSFQAQLVQVQTAQEARSRQAAGDIDNYMDDLHRGLNYLARVRGLTDLPQATQQRFLEALTRHNDAYEQLTLLDQSGQVVVSVAPPGLEPLRTSQAASPLFQQAVLQQEDAVGAVEIDQASGAQTLLLAVPVRSEQDEVAGALLARINLNFLGFVVAQTNVGTTGYVYIVDNRGVLVAAKTRRADARTLEDLSDRPFFPRITSAIAVPPATYIGLNSQEVLGSTAPIRSLGWNVVVELPTSEVYAVLYRMLWVMGAALLITVLLAVALGILYARQIVMPLQRLTNAAESISAGNLAVTVPARRRNELGVLGAAFNHMTTQVRNLIETLQRERNLTAVVLDSAGAMMVMLDQHGRILHSNHTSEQLVGAEDSLEGQLFWEVFIVPAEADAFRQAFAHIPTSQTPQSFENHLLRADGQERLIAWNHTVLHNKDDAGLSIISSGLDITERKRAEEQRAHIQAQIISAQAATLAELSTPLIPISDSVMVMPLIGALDEQRTQLVMETLLHGLEANHARIVVLDITGVPIIDTYVANMLIQTAQAVRLLGAEIVLTGIRPEVAQTLVGLGIDLSTITSSGTLQSGIAAVLSRNTARLRQRAN